MPSITQLLGIAHTCGFNSNRQDKTLPRNHAALTLMRSLFMTRCEKLDQMCFSLREMQVKALLFVIHGAVNTKMVWRAARTLPFHLPSPHLVDWSDFPVPSTTSSFYSQLADCHRICLLTPSTNNSLDLAVQSWHSSRAEGLVPTNSALWSCSEAVSESAVTHYPAPESAQAIFFFFGCFLYSNLLSGCRNANRKRSWQTENN